MSSQPDPWKALAEPFPESAIKTRPGRGNMTFSYVDARDVMQRLDDVVGPGGWDFTSQVIPGTDIVKGTLTVGGVVREDYGYPNSDHDEEPVKAASSDALKRCGVMFGIGRHLYGDNKAHTSGTGRASLPPARPAAAPRTTTDIPDDVPEFPDDGLLPGPTPARGRGETMWTKELFERAEAKGVDKKAISTTAKRLFGNDKWKVTDLTDEERYILAQELELVA